MDQYKQGTGEIKDELVLSRWVTYPSSVIKTDQKIQDAQKLIYNILMQVKVQQLELNKYSKQSVESVLSASSQTGLPQANNLQQWKNEDQIDVKHYEILKQCEKFYQGKLEAQQIRCISMRNQCKEIIRSQEIENSNLKKKIAELEKQIDQANSKMKKLQVDREEVVKLRKNQKQRIVEMLMKQKQEIFTKYAEVQKENLTLLNFTQEIETIIKKKIIAEQKDDDSNRMPYIKQIQLEATKYYSNLVNPINQQILNSFTQVINVLSKIYERRQQTRGSKSQREKSLKGSLKIPAMKVKMSNDKTKSSDYEIANLKQQLAKLSVNCQEKCKQLETALTYQKQKMLTMKKKIEKYQEELEKTNKQMEAFHLRQLDATKKIKWLEQELLQYERKFKLQIQSHKYEKLQQDNAVQKQEIQPPRSKSKSVFTKKDFNFSDLNSSNGRSIEMTSLETFQKEEIKKLKSHILQINRVSMNNEQQIKNLKKQIQLLETNLKNETRIKEEKEKQIEVCMQTVQQKDYIIQKLSLQIKNINQQLKKKVDAYNALKHQSLQKSEHVFQNQQRLQQILKAVIKISRHMKISINLLWDQQKNSKDESIFDQTLRQLSSIQKSWNQQLITTSKLNQQLERIRKQNLNLQKNIQKEISRLADIEQELRSAQQQNRTIQISAKNEKISIMSSLNDQITILRKQVQDNQSAILQKQLELESKIESNCILASKIEHLKSEFQLQLQENNRLKAKIAQLDTPVPQKEENDKNTKIESITKQLSQLNKILIQKDKCLILQSQQRKKAEDINKVLKNTLSQMETLLKNQLNEKQTTLNKLSDELDKQKKQKLSDVTQMEKQLSEKNQQINKLNQTISMLSISVQEWEEKAAENSKIHQQADNQNDDNLSQSKELSMMHSEINSFKEQLNQLLNTIESKDQQIQSLRQQLYGKYGKTSDGESRLIQRSVSDLPQHEHSTQKRDSSDLVSELQKQIELLKIQQTKHEILVLRVAQLENTLDKQKQLYQSEIMKNNIRITELQNELATKSKEQKSLSKKRVNSEQLFSLDPSNKFSSKGKTSQGSNINYTKIQRREKQSNQQIESEQVWHSLEDDFGQEQAIRKKQEKDLEQNSLPKTRIRREKSQQYERKNFKDLKVQKMSSIEKRYDSDQKSKQDIRKLTSTLKPRNQPLLQTDKANENKLPHMNKPQKEKDHKTNNLNSNQDIPHVTNSDNSVLNQIIKNLSQQNRYLKAMNEKMSRDLKSISQFIEIFDKEWKSKKLYQNSSEAGKLVSVDKLEENCKLLEASKIKLLEQFNAHDMEAIFDNFTRLVLETKRWITLIQRIIAENKRISLQIALYKRFPKLTKTRTLKYGDFQENHRRSRSVYSQGNVYKHHHIEVDEIPFQLMHEDHVNHMHQPNNLNNAQVPTNSLQILFRENQQMSEISSVKHKSHNSGFLNSKSQIAKMFEKGEKGEKHDKDMKQVKKEENRKDIIDQFSIFHQKGQKMEKQRFQKVRNPNFNLNFNSLNYNANYNKNNQNKIPVSMLQSSPLMQKSTSNYYQEGSNPDISLNRRLQEKSNKQRRKLMAKKNFKITSINAKIIESKKQYTQITKSIIQKYEQKISHLRQQFSKAMKKLMMNTVTKQQLQKMETNSSISKVTNAKTIALLEVSSSKKNSLPGRISQKDELAEEKMEELESKIDKLSNDLNSKQKSLIQARQQIKQLEKKIKQQKANSENIKSSYLSEMSNSSHLKHKIDKLNTDFQSFLTKIIKQGLKSQVTPKVSISKVNQIEKENPLSPKNLLINEAAKKFLKSKKNLKSESLPAQSIKQKQQDLTLQQDIRNSNKKQASTFRIQQESSLQLSPKRSQAVLKQSSPEAKKLSEQTSQIERTRSENSEITKKNLQQRQRDSGKADSESGKNLGLGSIFANILNPNALTRKKTISQASKPDQVTYYQQKLKQISLQIKRIITTQSFHAAKIKTLKSIQSQEEIFKSKKERESKIKNANDSEPEKIEKQPQSKIKDQQQISNDLKLLDEQINNYKKQVTKTFAQREQRLKEIVKNIIDTFKISRKSIDKILDLNEKKENSLAKYVDARLFFKNIYAQNKNKKQPAEQKYVSGAFQLGEQNTQLNIAITPQSVIEYESFEQKYALLQKQNDRLKTELAARILESQGLKREGGGGLHRDDSRKYGSRRQSFASNSNSEYFQDFENKELFDNTKPTFEFVQDLKIENQYYKKKCQEYEALNKLKKTQKVKYIRKW